MRALQTYEECVGRLKKLEINDQEICLILSLDDLKVAFPKDSPEAEALIRELGNEPSCQKIAVLKTDNPQHPILIRKLQSEGGVASGAFPNQRLNQS